VISDSSPGASRRRVRRPIGPVAAAALQALLVLHFSRAPELYAQAPDGLRSELAAQVSLPDFPSRLAAAADKATGVSELLALFEEFVPGVSDGPARRSFLIRWAALLELSGRWEEAAARYEDAAFAAPGQRDTASLLSAARSWLAAGETEKARSILRILGVASPDAAVRVRAQVLEGWARLIEGFPAEARVLAAQAASAPPDRETLLSALTLLWAASEGSARAESAARIRREFPGTPEAAMAETGEVPASAHWLLTPASGAVRPPAAPEPGSPAVPPGASSAAGPVPSASKTPDPSAARPVPSPPAGGRADSERVAAYQVGAFSEEANASALIRELAGKGVKASLERKERGGRPLWVVLVPAGTDSQATLLRLKDAGYEAYPVF